MSGELTMDDQPLKQNHQIIIISLDNTPLDANLSFPEIDIVINLDTDVNW